MKGIEYDVSGTGLKAVLKEWQIKAMEVVWGSPEGANSRTTWLKVNERLGGETISRASIINFLNDMKEMGVLEGDDRTGKGGHHWIYRAAMDEAAFKRFVAETLLESLMRDFPDETKAAINQLR